MIRSLCVGLLVLCAANCDGQIRRFVVNADSVKAAGKFPPEVQRPRTFGFAEIGFEAGDYSKFGLTILEPGRFVAQAGEARIGYTVFDGVQDVAFVGLHFASGGQSYRSNSSFERCRFSAETVQGFRVRFNSTATFSCCDFTRENIPTTSDVVGLYVSDGPCEVYVSGCNFSGYTDGIQFGYRSNSDAGNYAGSIVDGCTFTVPTKFMRPDGTMTPGLENGIDIKADGNEVQPLLIRNCTFHRFRPALLNGAGTPGYAITFHGVANWTRIEGCKFLDCESAIAFNQTESTPTNYFLTGNRYIDIRSHGAVTPWPQIQGAVFSGRGRFKSVSDRFENCFKIQAFEVPGQEITR